MVPLLAMPSGSWNAITLRVAASSVDPKHHQERR